MKRSRAGNLLPGVILAVGFGFSIGFFLISRDAVDRQVRDSFHLTVSFEAAAIKDNMLMHEKELREVGAAVQGLGAGAGLQRYLQGVDFGTNFPGFETIDFISASGGLQRLYPAGERVSQNTYAHLEAELGKARAQKFLVAIASPGDDQIITWVQPLEGGDLIISKVSLARLIHALFRDRAVYTLDPGSQGVYFEVISISTGGLQKHLYFPMPADFEDTAGRTLPYMILGSGSIISLLLFIVIRSLSGARDQALTLAEKMTEDFRRATSEAIRANQAKSEFLASMSHEIRNPIHVITGMSEILAGTNLAEDQRDYLRSLRNAGDHLLGLINDILDLSRIESGQLELEEIDFSLKEAAGQVMELYRYRAQEKGIALNLNFEPDAPDIVRGDPVRFRQILVNLTGNAMKFTAKGSVTIRVEKHPLATEKQPGVHVSVTDTGIGIPADKQAAVFEKFTQVDTSTTRRFGGTGLGLAICKRLTAMMHGDIGLESEPGRGSTFFFRVMFTAPAGTAAAPVAAPIPVSDRPIRILLAEDAEDNRSIIALFLRAVPHELTITENGEEAVAAFAPGKFDVILMDNQMPVMDGLTAVRQIRAMEREAGKPPTRILALTADSTRKDIERSLDAGCDGHLTKPIRRDVLVQAVRSAT